MWCSDSHRFYAFLLRLLCCFSYAGGIIPAVPPANKTLVDDLDALLGGVPAAAPPAAATTVVAGGPSSAPPAVSDDLLNLLGMGLGPSPSPAPVTVPPAVVHDLGPPALCGKVPGLC